MTDITEYTPGPWWMRESATSFSVRAADGGIAKASISPRSARAAEGRANARLIAAAPALLAAVRELAGFINVAGYTDAKEMAALERARAAINAGTSNGH